MSITGDTDAYWWLVRWRSLGSWYQRLIPSGQQTLFFPAAGVDGVVATAIDRVGNASTDAVRRP